MFARHKFPGVSQRTVAVDSKGRFTGAKGQEGTAQAKGRKEAAEWTAAGFKARAC